MSACLLLGRANVGKTLFMLNFAEYLGLRNLCIELESPGGIRRQEMWSVAEARIRLVGKTPHQTRELQSIQTPIRIGKARRTLLLADSAGLTEGIHTDSEVRSGMAQTLRRLMQSELVLHIMDAAAIGQHTEEPALKQLDRQLVEFASRHAAYLILANKMDLPWARTGLARLRAALSGERIIPISALRKQGFREVRAFVADRL